MLRGVWRLYSGPKRYVRKTCGLHVRLELVYKCLDPARKIGGAFGACIAAQNATWAFPACMPVWSVYSGSKRYVGKVWGLHVRLELVYKCLSGVGATSSRGQCASRLLRGVWSLYSGPKRYLRKVSGLRVQESRWSSSPIVAFMQRFGFVVWIVLLVCELGSAPHAC